MKNILNKFNLEFFKSLNYAKIIGIILLFISAYFLGKATASGVQTAKETYH